MQGHHAENATRAIEHHNEPGKHHSEPQSKDAPKIGRLSFRRGAKAPRRNLLSASPRSSVGEGQAPLRTRTPDPRSRDPSLASTVVIPTPERSDEGGIWCRPRHGSCSLYCRVCHYDAGAKRGRRNLLSPNPPHLHLFTHQGRSPIGSSRIQ